MTSSKQKIDIEVGDHFMVMQPNGKTRKFMSPIVYGQKWNAKFCFSDGAEIIEIRKSKDEPNRNEFEFYIHYDGCKYFDRFRKTVTAASSFQAIAVWTNGFVSIASTYLLVDQRKRIHRIPSWIWWSCKLLEQWLVAKNAATSRSTTFKR